MTPLEIQLREVGRSGVVTFVIVLSIAGFEDRFQREAGLCSSAICPALVKVSYLVNIFSHGSFMVLTHPAGSISTYN